MLVASTVKKDFNSRSRVGSDVGRKRGVVFCVFQLALPRGERWSVIR